jgi:diacylglycerol kinase
VQAERGLVRGVRSDSAFFVHFFGIVIVIAAAVVLGIGWMQWVAIAGCLTLVLTAEMFNQALKTLARSGIRHSALTPPPISGSNQSTPPGENELSPEVQRALAIATAAVLVACTGSTVVLTLVFWQRFDQLF